MSPYVTWSHDRSEPAGEFLVRTFTLNTNFNRNIIIAVSMYRSLARRIARSSVGDLESHQGIDRRDSECSVESSSSASSGSNSKRKRPVRAFPTDSNDVDPWVLHHVLDEELGIGNWELQVNTSVPIFDCITLICCSNISMDPSSLQVEI